MKFALLFAFTLACTTAFADEGKQGHGDRLSDFDARLIHTMGKEGHGGHGVVCTNSSESISSVRLFDLWESERVWGLVPADYGSMSWREIVAKRLSQLTEPKLRTFSHVATMGEMILQNIQFLREDEKLPEIDDEDETLLPKRCEKRTVASYLSDEKILIDTELWEMMSEVDKAGLILHEAWYRHLRQTDGITGSRRVRKINAFFLAEKGFVDPQEGLESTKSYFCFDGDEHGRNRFYLILDKNPEAPRVRAQFASLGGETVISRALSVDIPVVFGPNGLPEFHGAFLTEDAFDGSREIWMKTNNDNRLKIEMGIRTNDHRGYLGYRNIICNALCPSCSHSR